jgi:hypothetical protein
VTTPANVISITGQATGAAKAAPTLPEFAALDQAHRRTLDALDAVAQSVITLGAQWVTASQGDLAQSKVYAQRGDEAIAAALTTRARHTAEMASEMIATVRAAMRAARKE